MFNAGCSSTDEARLPAAANVKATCASWCSGNVLVVVWDRNRAGRNVNYDAKSLCMKRWHSWLGARDRLWERRLETEKQKGPGPVHK